MRIFMFEFIVNCNAWYKRWMCGEHYSGFRHQRQC